MSLDFPRAWQIAKASDMEDHHPKCSYLQTQGGILCDCDVINKHPEFLDKSVLFGKDGIPFQKKNL